MDQRRFNDYQKENRFFLNRAVVAFLFVLVLMAILVSRIYFLQVVEHDRFSLLSENNRIKLQPVAPRRGLIYDRNGELLAENRPSFSLTLLKEEVDDVDSLLDDVSTLVELSSAEVESFKKRLKHRRRPHSTVPLKSRLTEEEIAKLSVNFYRLPGLQIEAEFLGIREMKINDVIFDKETDMAEITVSFISELISVVKNSDGEILEGDEKQSKRQKDVWTFSKDIKSQDPVWFLVATGE